MAKAPGRGKYMAKVTSKSQVTAPRSAPHRPDELGVSKSRESRIHSFDQATERDGKRRVGALVDTNLLVCTPSRPLRPADCISSWCWVGQAIRLPELALRAKRGRGELRSAAGRRNDRPPHLERQKSAPPG